MSEEQHLVFTQTNTSQIPRFLITGGMDSSVSKEFLSFHTEAVKQNVTEALMYIDSPGGSMSVVSTIGNIIQSGEIMYHTIAMGEACSAACVLTALGSFRWAVPETMFLFHDASYFIGGKQRELEETVEIQKIFIEKTLTKFASHTNKSKKFWMDMAYGKATNDYYFDAETALEYGVIDFIGMPTIGKQSQFVVELPIAMEDFEELMNKRGVHTDEEHTSKVPSKKIPARKRAKKIVKKKGKTK